MAKTDLNIAELMDIVKYLEEEGEKETEEKVLKDALDKSEDPMVRWTLLINLAGFYYSNRMYGDVDKTADQLIREFPDNYAGYHARLIVLIEHGELDQAEECMDSIPEELLSHREYLSDYLKLRIARGDTEYTEPILAILSSEYGDRDATISLMAMHFMRGEHAESGILAKAILDEDAKNPSYRSYLAYLFQINNLYMLSDKHPEGKVKEWMRSALEWVKDYLENTEMEEKEEVDRLIRKMEQMVTDEEPEIEK